MLGQILENLKQPQNTSYLFPVKKQNTRGDVEGTLRGHLSILLSFNPYEEWFLCLEITCSNLFFKTCDYTDF